MKFKFIGKPDKIFPTLKTGKIYDLVIASIYWNIFDVLKGRKRPQIIFPIVCPYSSWEAFYENWKSLRVNNGK